MSVLLPVRPTHDGVFIDIVDRDVTKKDLGGGKVLHLIADDGFSGPHNPMMHQHPGIRPRWARVLEVGPDVDEVAVGDLVLCDTLKWGRRIPLGRLNETTVYFWNIKVTDILMTRDLPADDRYVENTKKMLSRMEINIGRL